jgi:hypothetical protein
MSSLYEAADANEALRYEEVTLRFMQQRNPSLTETISMCASSCSFNAGKFSEECALPHSALPSLNTLKEQVLPMSEIAVRTSEGIRLCTGKLDMGSVLSDVGQKRLQPL